MLEWSGKSEVVVLLVALPFPDKQLEWRLELFYHFPEPFSPIFNGLPMFPTSPWPSNSSTSQNSDWETKCQLNPMDYSQTKVLEGSSLQTQCWALIRGENFILEGWNWIPWMLSQPETELLPEDALCSSREMLREVLLASASPGIDHCLSCEQI